jgi:hypothetical protein
MNFPSESPIGASTTPFAQVEPLRAIAYSMDTLIPGVYLWTPFFSWRMGGSVAEATYPGRVHSKFGVALVLPGYRIFTTYRDSYDPRSPQN